MRFGTYVYRTLYGVSFFLTHAPDEKHNTMMLRLCSEPVPVVSCWPRASSDLGIVLAVFPRWTKSLESAFLLGMREGLLF